MKNQKLGMKVGIVALGLSVFVQGYLALLHYNLKFGQMEGKSLCNISQTFNCDAVSLSEYATVLGAPLALWGLLTNLVVLLLFLGVAVSPESAALRFKAWLGTLFIFIASIVMAVISTAQLQTFCLFCIFAYVLSVAAAWAGYQIRAPFSEARLFEKTNLTRLLAAGISVPLFTLLFHSMVMNNVAKGADRAVLESLQEWKTGPDASLGTLHGLIFGAEPQQAKMLIVEFADFQCIHCKMAAPVLKNFVASRKDVSLVYQSFPLDGKCNAAVNQQGDGKSCELAKAALCASKQSQKQGWALHEWIFEHFGKAELSELSEFAQSIGLNMEEFRACREAPETSQQILAQAAAGEKAGVKGTPTIFVNGRVLPRGAFLMVLEAAYKELK